MILLKKISQHNWWAILYFNFKMLPFQQAIKLPFDFYYKIRFENLCGKIRINSSNIRRGMIKIGGRGSEMFSRNQTILDVKGEIEFRGNTEIGHGALLRVEKNGKIIFGNEVRIGALTKVFCEESITFNDEIDFSWECQIFDSNFHYTRNTKTNTIDKKTSPITIGSLNWFGNRVTIMKGTQTPTNIIVASNSLCNKNYTSLPEYTVLGGIPVKEVSFNVQRIFENIENIDNLGI